MQLTNIALSLALTSTLIYAAPVQVVSRPRQRQRPCPSQFLYLTLTASPPSFGFHGQEKRQEVVDKRLPLNDLVSLRIHWAVDLVNSYSPSFDFHT